MPEEFDVEERRARFPEALGRAGLASAQSTWQSRNFPKRQASDIRAEYEHVFPIDLDGDTIHTKPRLRRLRSEATPATAARGFTPREAACSRDSSTRKQAPEPRIMPPPLAGRSQTGA